MSDIFFSELAIPQPSYTLGIGSLGHGAMTGRMLEALEQIFLKERPDLALVYGDTNSTLAGALAAAKLHIPVAHVEAGMRSYNRQMPEEINRVMTDHLSRWLFAVSPKGELLLAQEGLVEGVFVVGDVMLDILKQCEASLAERPILNGLGLRSKQYALATVHRAENTDQLSNLQNIVQALNTFSQSIPVIWPIHPRTAQAIKQHQLSLAQTIQVQEPLGYGDMLALTSQAAVVLTDSGGLQKEAFYLQVPCITLRNETEWLETIETGWNFLAGNQPDQILNAAEKCLRQPPQGEPPGVYGDGHAAEKIVAHLIRAFQV